VIFIKKIILLLSIISIIFLTTNKEEIIIPENAIRFRIIGASNTLGDQLLKEEIKEDLLTNVLPNLDNEDIDSSINKNIVNIKSTLNKYDVSYDISFGNNYFPAKVYKGITYKAGYYKSLVITLGSGKGDNFWCVMYPPLCLIDNSSDVTYKSLALEILKKYE